MCVCVCLCVAYDLQTDSGAHEAYYVFIFTRVPSQG
jgi:hypothetical protein